MIQTQKNHGKICPLLIQTQKKRVMIPRRLEISQLIHSQKWAMTKIRSTNLTLHKTLSKLRGFYIAHWYGCASVKV